MPVGLLTQLVKDAGC